MTGDINETVTNHTSDEKVFHLFSTESKWINKIHKYAEEYPDDVHIEFENDDGSLCAEIPMKWFKVSPPRHVSDEQKEKASKRFKAMWADKQSGNDKDDEDE